MKAVWKHQSYTSLRWSMALLAFFSLAMSPGCETTDRSKPPQWVQFPITDVSEVAGKWDGLMRRIPPDRRDDWVTVAIAPMENMSSTASEPSESSAAMVSLPSTRAD